jgi:hypothetical protein
MFNMASGKIRYQSNTLYTFKPIDTIKARGPQKDLRTFTIDKGTPFLAPFFFHSYIGISPNGR